MKSWDLLRHHCDAIIAVLTNIALFLGFELAVYWFRWYPR